MGKVSKIVMRQSGAETGTGMHKVLGKRVFRDFKKNILSYLALMLLIILGMYMITGMVGAAETIIHGTKLTAKEHFLEDGEFQVFVPLKSGEIQALTKRNITLEKMFYLDFTVANAGTLRVYQNREKINLFQLEEGSIPDQNNQIALEKRYCEEHGFHVGDTIKIGDMAYQIVGIGTLPDYEAPYRKAGDMAVDSSLFGVGIVCKASYQRLEHNLNMEQTEQYTYAYLLNNAMTDAELKEELKKDVVTADQVQDQNFQEYWKRTGGVKDMYLNAAESIRDGGNRLSDTLTCIDGSSSALQQGAEQILRQYLKEANAGIVKYGVREELTENNYNEILSKIRKQSDDKYINDKLSSLQETIGDLKQYRDSVSAYTKAVGQVQKGSSQLADGLQKFDQKTNDMAEKYWNVKLNNMTAFMPRGENPRIGAAADDQRINKMCGLAAGVIVMILFTYVISVFVIHGIEKESSVIGALYALGVQQKDLILHYLMLPVLVTLIAAALGSILGLSRYGIMFQMQDCYAYYSIPTLAFFYSKYLILYGFVMPPAIAAAVNFTVIRKYLAGTPLSLMRKEQRQVKIRKLKLGNMGFIRKFQIANMIKELRTGITVFFGMFISLLIVMLSLNCYLMCRHVAQESERDTGFEYLYLYKYPDKTVPESGEAAFAKTMHKKAMGYNMDITLLGIRSGNPYFNVKTEKSESKAVIASAFAQKFRLKKGDTFYITDEEEDRNYAFTVSDITQYGTGMYVFMNIDSMRDLFDESDSYFNAVFSDKELAIDPGKLYSTVTKAEIVKSSAIFTDMMRPMILMLAGVSALIFAVVLYLMMNVMIARSALNISMFKMFGYHKKELQKLYLNGNMDTVAAGALICIPAAKILMNRIYPYMISNVAAGMNVKAQWWMYAGIYAMILVLYGVINMLQVRKIDQITPAEILRNRE